jgi:uncharacterized integral membrane protein
MRREDEPPRKPVMGPDSEPVQPIADAHEAHEAREAADRERRARIGKGIVGLLLLIILILFITTNVESTKVHFVFFSGTLPLIWVMLGCAIIGGVVGFLLGRPGRQLPGRRDERKS